MRSLITLKALTYEPTGGIVAAPTTSLPEWIGGVRNWDYRYCWLRDATFTLLALLRAGYIDEAAAWRNGCCAPWPAVPPQLQIMYGVAGERRLTELSSTGWPATRTRKPVRIGNAASEQFQLDVYGEVMVPALRNAAGMAFGATTTPGRCELAILDFWKRPGTGPTKASGRSADRGGTSPIPR